MTAMRNPLILIRRAAWPARGPAHHRQFPRLCRRRRQWRARLGRLSPGQDRARRRARPARSRARPARASRPTCSIRASADPDLADEMVRRELGLVRPDEVIIPLDDRRRRPPPPPRRAARAVRVRPLGGAMLRAPAFAAIEPQPSTDERAGTSGQGSIAEARRRKAERPRRPPTPNRERPPEPKRYKASQGRAARISTARCCSSAASRSAPASFTASA